MLILRLLVVAVLIVTLAILGARVNRWWCARWRCLLPAAGTGLIAVCIGMAAAIALIRDQPGGASTVFTLLGAVAVLMQACTVGLGGVHPRGEHQSTGFYQADRDQQEHRVLRRERT